MIKSVTIAWGKKYLDNYFKFHEANSIYFNKIKTRIKFYLINKLSEENFIKEKIKHYHGCIKNISLPDTYFRGNKYIAHKNILNLIINNKSKIKFYNEDFIFLGYPDTIFSSDLFIDLIKKTNFKIIFCPGPRIIEKKKELDYLFKKKKIFLKSEVLSKIIINNLHPKMDLMTINSKYFNNAPAWIIDKNKYGIKIKSHHLTPLMFKKKLLNNKLYSYLVIDDYLTNNFLTKKIYVYDNSTKGCWCSFEKKKSVKNLESYLNTKNYFDTLKWIKTCTTKYQRFLIKKFSYLIVENKQNIKKLENSRNIEFFLIKIKALNFLKFF